MATYYNGGSELQGTDGLQTLVLMNPGYVYYSDSQQSTQPPAGNFMFLDNSNHPGNNQINNHHQEANMTAQTQQYVGIPLSASPPSSVHSQHDVSSLHAFIPRAQYMYNPVEMVAREVTPFQQGLSLSLSSQQSRFGSHAAGNSRSPIGTWAQATGVVISPSSDDGRADTPRGAGDPGGDGGLTSSPSRASNSVNGMHTMLLNSKYLKATQEILEEVVNVGKVALKNSDQSTKNVNIGGGGGGGDAGSVSLPSPINREGEATKSNGGNELTTAERQEIQMKKAKLVNMLDEVEQRYRQYHHQMQIVVSWFEQAAGIGSAKTYTALALQTISKQFRCLKDAITGQMKAASRSLGEEESLTKADGGGSRLKFVDNQLRQQRALQQLGMIQNNAWRPQRGLPERSVSVLRAWLFEHFLHPYPKDSDKVMLAKQTGLTRSQVSNWFINARVRLWKPMVEEMYLEEIKEQQHNQKEDHKSTEIDHNNNSSSKQGNTLSPENINRAFRPTKQETSFNPNPTTTGTQFQFQNQNQNHSTFTLTGPLETDGITQFSPKKPRNNFIGGLGGYSIGEIGEQFRQQYSGNGVSLTLGLPDCENLSISGSDQRFVPNQSMQLRRGAELGENDYAGMNPPAAVYDSMNIESRKRFAAQPLPDFVA